MTRKGFIDPATLGVLAGLSVGIFGAKWAPFEFLKPKPPTAQLTKLQSDLAKSQADTANAQQAATAAIAAERARLETMLRSAQQDTLGIITAQNRVPAVNRTAELKLATAMANRVSFKLVAAVGALPQDQQDAMVQLIDQALSDKQSEVDAANAKLAARDKEFATVSAERDTIKAEIPVLTAKAAKAEETTKAVQAQVTAKTDEVKIFADKADAKERENGSLSGALASAIRWLIGIAIGWVFLAFVLPAIVKVMRAGPIKNFLRDVSGFILNPIHHADAKTKIADLTAAQPTTAT